jgi:hypothetical protein
LKFSKLENGGQLKTGGSKNFTGLTGIVMKKNAVVFSGRNALDLNELRMNVVRIPEVTIRIRQAQKILDTVEGAEPVDLLALVSSDDELFFKNIKLKSLLAAIVQVGLFDRFAKSQRRPDFLVGTSNGDSAMKVCAGLLSFEEMVRGGQEEVKTNVVELMAAAPAPLLSGVSLNSFGALGLAPNEAGYQPVKADAMELKTVLSTLHADFGVDRFINIGPTSALKGTEIKALGSDEIETLDSIELDPMLAWFWRGLDVSANTLNQ